MTHELLFRVTMKDCDRETFRVSGAGGQHRDKTSNGVRIRHRASGAVGESRQERSQHKNEQIAFRRMAESDKFETWRRMEAGRLMGLFPKSIDEIVDEMMADENLIVEIC
jgi:protein subunit release factor A